MQKRNRRPLSSITALQKQFGYINHLWLIFWVCGDPDRALHKNSYPFLPWQSWSTGECMTVHECETMGVFLRFIRRAIKHLNRCVYSVITALMKRESGLLAHLECVYVCVYGRDEECQMSFAVCQTDSPIRRGGGLVHWCSSRRTIKSSSCSHIISFSLCVCVKLFNGSLCNGVIKCSDT